VVVDLASGKHKEHVNSGIHHIYNPCWSLNGKWFLATVGGGTGYGIASFGKKNYPVLYRQESPFVFSDATASAGLAQLPPTSQAAWADFNNDGHLDLVTGGKLLVHQGTASRRRARGCRRRAPPSTCEPRPARTPSACG
jgi:hypothetical protein